MKRTPSWPSALLLGGWMLLSCLPAAAAEPVRATGKVDPGARIEIFPAWEDYDAAVRRLESGAALKPVATARPEADGSFKIEAPEAGAFTLVVRAEGRLAMRHPLVPWVEEVLLPDASLPPAGSGDMWGRGPREPSSWWPADLDAGGSEDRTARLRVDVRNADGRPVPGALVRRGTRAVAMTGPDGGVEVTLRPEDSFLIVEDREGGWARLDLPIERRTVLVRPRPPRMIAGRVIDAVSKSPLPGALVWIGRPLLAPAVRSGVDGSFRIAIPAGEEPLLEAAAGGYAPLPARPVKPGERGPVVLELEPAATLSGVVVDGADRPVPGATILADPPRASVYPIQWAQAHSGPDGGFRLTGLRPAGAYRLHATHERFVRAVLTAQTAPAGRRTPPVRIVLGEGQTAVGRLVDEGGQPVPGAALELMGLKGVMGAKGASDAVGRFQIRGLSSGEYELRVERPDVSPVHLQDIQIPPGSPVVDLGDVELPSGGAIEGRVADVRGAPVAGARISFSPAQREGPRGVYEPVGDTFVVKTGENGSFQARGLHRGRSYDLQVRHPDYREVTVPDVEVPAAEPVRIVLRPNRALSGKVVGSEGEAVEGASLFVVEEIQVGGALSYSMQSVARTDSGGWFFADQLLPGTLTLEVQAEGYPSRRVDGLLLPEDQDLRGLEIILDRGVQLDVRVLGAAGEPAVDALVEAEPEAGAGRPFEYQGAACTTDLRGRCRLAVPEAGLYTVRATAQGAAAAARVEAAGGIILVEIRLASGVEVSGWVIDEDGVAVSRASIVLTSPTGEFQTFTEPDGNFRFSGVADGQYRVRAVQTLTSASSAVLEILVAGRPVRNLELRFQAGALLTGRVTGLEAGERREAVVSAAPEPPRYGDPGLSGYVDALGEYRIPGLTTGEWKVRAHTATGRQAEGTLRIDPGAKTARLDLELPPRGPRLSGRVLVDGSPLAGALIQGWRQSTLIGQGATAHDGSFAFDLQEPGGITLLIGGPQGIGAARSIQAAEDAEATVEIRTSRLRGTVTGPTGEPVQGAVVRVEGWSPELQAAFSALTLRSGPDGGFQAPRLAAGTVRIGVQAPGLVATEILTEVPPGGERAVEIRLTSPDER
jgi:Carboxypeptidase regulatory-like domain